jgi:hydroxymethylbilane synthase
LIRIGSRGSKLALWQANFVAEAVRTRGESVEIIVIRTTGDQLQEASFPTPGKGLFTTEIENALRRNEIDVAVHSLKDLPTEIAPEFCLAAIPPRADARDVLLAREKISVATLAPGAHVATSSPRRRGQLLYLRQDLQVEPIRGNVDTRIRRMIEGDVDAIVLAAAGMERLQLTAFVQDYLAPEVMCPAPGQGALGIQCRANDPATCSTLAFLDDAATRFCVEVERNILAALGGGCSVPVGVYCAPEGNGHRVWSAVCSADGTSMVRVEHAGREDSEDLVLKISERLRREGAEAILARAGN